MKSLLSFILLVVFITGSSFQGTQNDAGETIIWTPKAKITWKDFKKSLTGNAIEAAYSVCGIYISANPQQLNDSTILVDIHAFFSKTLSSKTTEKDLLKEGVLVHEQGHFDITEWYARMLRKDIMDARFQTIDEFYKNVQGMYNKEVAAFNAAQQKYDKETHHSMNADAQQKWDKAISEGIAKYAPYNNPQLKVVIKK
jgi:hypothetical protein